MTNILISEIFGPTLQGEGALIGQPTVFVRTGGCDFRCTWCDTLYAVLPKYKDEWEPMTPVEIFEKVQELSGGVPLLVTLSGGNPALQPMAELLRIGKKNGYRFALETQGSKHQDWFSGLDYLILSPKPPSSGMETDWKELWKCVYGSDPLFDIVFKIVIFDDADYDYALQVYSKYSSPSRKFYLQTGNSQVLDDDVPQPYRTNSWDGLGHEALIATTLNRTRWLAKKVIADRLHNVTVLPQFHTLLWGNKRGV